MARPRHKAPEGRNPDRLRSDPLTRMVSAEARYPTIATRRSLVLLPEINIPVSPFDPLPEIEDYRTFHPSERPPRLYGGGLAGSSISRLTAETNRDVRHFDNARHVIICHRRKTRREVLHAMQKTGGGGGKKRRYRRNPNSEVYC